MRRIGLLGGMSWESTVLYYRHINERVRDELGGLHSADLVMHSFDFEEIASLQRIGDWSGAGARLGRAARALVDAGAECIVICTNTMHLVASDVAAHAGVPVLHIADVLAEAAHAAGVTRLGLLATSFTMEHPFYREHLEGHGLQVLVPGPSDRREVHRVIFEELCQGVCADTSKAAYVRIADELVERGAQGIVFGCTEVGLLLSPEDFVVPVFDTTVLHARAAADIALGRRELPSSGTTRRSAVPEPSARLG